MKSHNINTPINFELLNDNIYDLKNKLLSGLKCLSKNDVYFLYLSHIYIYIKHKYLIHISL